jgi:NADH dehydrogenase [ubiquinone] 1 alpha subcomplex assembly factor 7
MFDEILPLDIFFALSVEKYYKNHEDCIGKNGDFITAPEASQMFCHAIGVWIYNQIHNSKEKISLIELGGGYGTLMNEVLNILKDGIVQDVYFVETSLKMIEKQKEAVSNHIHIRFHWVDSIKKIPSNIKHIVIANEFFDALPVNQFIYSDGNFRELYVSPKMQLIQSQNVIGNEEMQKIMQFSNTTVEDCNEGDILEISTASLAILDDICKIASAALIIDYGYSNSKKKNTIKAIANHTILDDFLVMPGSADISAEVDFSILQSFIKKYYSTYSINYTTQKEFLIDNHIEVIVNKARQHIKNHVDLKLINSELHKITVEMGNFKVLSFHSA